MESTAALYGYAASVLAAAIVGGIKILSNCVLKKQNRQQAHEVLIADRFEKHENGLATRFESMAKSFEAYASTERQDRKAANERVMEIHENTIVAISEIKDVVSGMRIALDQNTKAVQERK